MTHFLARLVERARGSAPRIEPIIAPRFAPAPVVEITSESEASLQVRRETRPPEAIESPNPKIVRQEEIESPSRDEESTGKSIAPLQETLLVPSEIQEAPPPLIVRSTEKEDRQFLVTTNGAVRGASSSRPVVARPGSAIPSTTARARAIERAVELPNEPRTEAPIVRVTIGRIEVRADPPPAVAPRKPPRASEPKLTLDAYLKSRKEGAR